MHNESRTDTTLPDFQTLKSLTKVTNHALRKQDAFEPILATPRLGIPSSAIPLSHLFRI